MIFWLDITHTSSKYAYLLATLYYIWKAEGRSVKDASKYYPGDLQSCVSVKGFPPGL
jgi:beta-mannanase